MLRIRAVGSVKIFDGQHRRRAIGDLILELAEGKESVAGRRNELLQSAMPIALYAEADIRSLRQMFSDAAKTKSLFENWLIWRDCVVR